MAGYASGLRCRRLLLRRSIRQRDIKYVSLFRFTRYEAFRWRARCRFMPKAQRMGFRYWLRSFSSAFR